MTNFLASVVGWYFVIFSLAILCKHQAMVAIFNDFFKNRASVFIVAVITVILGLMMVVSHNIWAAGWTLVVTVIGWFVLISGVLRMFFLEETIKMGKNFIQHALRMRLTAIIILLVGLFLLFHVYMA